MFKFVTPLGFGFAFSQVVQKTLLFSGKSVCSDGLSLPVRVLIPPFKQRISRGKGGGINGYTRNFNLSLSPVLYKNSKLKYLV